MCLCGSFRAVGVGYFIVSSSVVFKLAWWQGTSFARVQNRLANKLTALLLKLSIANYPPLCVPILLECSVLHKCEAQRADLDEQQGS